MGQRVKLKKNRSSVKGYAVKVSNNSSKKSNQSNQSNKRRKRKKKN